LPSAVFHLVSSKAHLPICQMKTDPRTRNLWTVVGGLTLLLALVLLVPWQPQPYDHGSDSSWWLALHHFHDSRAVFGRDVVFSYGPLGYIGTRTYFPSTYWISVVAWCVFAFAFWLTSFFLAKRHMSNPYSAAVLMFALIVIVGYKPCDSLFYSLIALFLFTYFSPGPGLPSTSITAFLSGILALAALIKFSFLPACLACILLTAVHQVFIKKRFPVPLLTFLVTLILASVFEHQPLSYFGPFLINSYRVAEGYSGAMAIKGSLRPVAGYVLVSATLISLGLCISHRQRSVALLLPVAGLATILLFAFKSGFVRSDAIHLPIALNSLAAVCLLYSVIVWNQLEQVPARILIICSLLVSLALVFRSIDATPTIESLRAQITGCVRRLSGRPGLENQFRQELKTSYGKYALLSVVGDFDLYRTYAAVLLANGFTYNPRPTIQSYAAYSRYLADLNAQKLRDGRSAQNIVVEMSTIDDRFPTLDDSLSLPELWTRYRIDGRTPQFAIMRRRTTPLQYSIVTPHSRSAQAGERIAVPGVENGAIWATLELRPSLAGRLAMLLYKAMQPEILVETADGRRKTYYLPAAMASVGFVLSPVIESPQQFEDFASPAWSQTLAPNVVTAITIVHDNGSARMFESGFTVTFATLKMQRE